MTVDIKEREFENHVESTLHAKGYIRRKTSDFDSKLALDKELVINFLKDSQPASWRNIEGIFGLDTEDEVLRKLVKELEEQGMIQVLRYGFTVSAVHFDCAYFKPVSGRNPDSSIQYNKNILSIIRQARYNQEKSVDLILCLNGLPVATAELKNPATGQSYLDAIKQYKQDRDPAEKVFEFKKRAIVHFGIDPYEVHITTHLDGQKTNFLPFNKGRNGGRGNPDNPDSYRTAYLWEQKCGLKLFQAS